MLSIIVVGHECFDKVLSIAAVLTSVVIDLVSYRKAIGKLLSLTPREANDEITMQQEKQQPLITFSGMAQRAGAVLERMEKCSPLSLQNSQFRRSDNATTHTSSTTASIHDHFPRHLLLTKHALPTPTIKIYNMVLMLYAEESGPLHVAQQAEDIVYSMMLRSMFQPDKSEEAESIMPTVNHLNCVLKCWSKSIRADRGIHAYSYLRAWNEWSKQQNQKDNYADLESYCLVLQSCLAHKSDEIDGTMNEVAREMSLVAIRLWTELEVASLTPDSRAYSLLLRAICQTAELPSNSANTPALTALARVFRKCCRGGLLTLEILELVRNATNDTQFSKLVENKVKLVSKDGAEVPLKKILETLPDEWRKNMN